jgi:hypothetical protein
MSIDRRKNRSLMKMIAEDMQPFSIVEDKDFKSYTHDLDPSYDLPNTRILKNQLMPELYAEVEDALTDK